MGPVPVPAPVPIPIWKPVWYFRGDVGVGLAGGPDASESGLIFGKDSVNYPFELPEDFGTSDTGSLVTLGVGVGKYWNNFFRTDFTAEWRSSTEHKYSGNYEYYARPGDTLIQGKAFDKTTVRGGIFLFNGYFDFYRGEESRWTPYLGGGVGFAWNSLEREHRTEEQQCSPCNSGIRDEVEVRSKNQSLSFAANVMAGVGYRFSDTTSVDLNYRFLYVGGSDATLGIWGKQFGGVSKVSVDDTFEHQLRAGLRFDIN